MGETMKIQAIATVALAAALTSGAAFAQEEPAESAAVDANTQVVSRGIGTIAGGHNDIYRSQCPDGRLCDLICRFEGDDRNMTMVNEIARWGFVMGENTLVFNAIRTPRQANEFIEMYIPATAWCGVGLRSDDD